MTDLETYTDAQLKNRSYSVSKTIAVGATATIGRRAFYYAEIPAGTQATVLSYDNAGFNGITARLQLEDGRHVTVSAGILL